jgi:hypothetical protein
MVRSWITKRIREMILFQAIRSQWKETTVWLLYTLVGGLLPVWGGAVLIKLFFRTPELGNFADNGEFALYSAALVAPLLYFITKDLKTSNFAYRPLMALATIVILLVSTLLMAAVNSLGAVGIPVSVDKVFLRNWTIWLLFFSVVLSFVVTALDSARMSLDYNSVMQQNYENLQNQFEQLRKKK